MLSTKDQESTDELMMIFQYLKSVKIELQEIYKNKMKEIMEKSDFKLNNDNDFEY